jgi:hypothetical protein
MDANCFLKRIVVITVASALPAFASVASGHSSGGSSGGHSSGGSSGGPSSNGSSGGHSSSASNSGHSSSASNSGHSFSASNSGHSSGHPSKVGHAAGNPGTDPVAATGGRSTLASSVHPGTVRSRPVTVTEGRRVSTGYTPNEQWRDYWRRKHHWIFF